MAQKKVTKKVMVLNSMKKIDRLAVDMDILRTVSDKEKDLLENLLGQGREF